MKYEVLSQIQSNIHLNKLDIEKIGIPADFISGLSKRKYSEKNEINHNHIMKDLDLKITKIKKRTTFSKEIVIDWEAVNKDIEEQDEEKKNEFSPEIQKLQDTQFNVEKVKIHFSTLLRTRIKFNQDILQDSLHLNEQFNENKEVEYFPDSIKVDLPENKMKNEMLRRKTL